MKPEDESFTGKCPTCGQEYLAERVRELSAEVERKEADIAALNALLLADGYLDKTSGSK